MNIYQYILMLVYITLRKLNEIELKITEFTFKKKIISLL